LELIENFTMKPTAQPDREAASVRSPSTEIAAAIDLLWTRFLPEIRQRVDLLEAAAAACVSRRLSTAQREAAHSAAHKLAGTLGTFNLSHGTELAREFELVFSSEEPPGTMIAEHLAIIANELRTIVDGRK
jgi:HPt (histidine-containing phosphotransfer) domain-containing protein